MITIFTLPKSMKTKHIRLIQSNALKSWRALGRDIEIIVLGKGQGIRELARSCGAQYRPQIATNRYGTPLISDAFAQVRRVAKYERVMYSNADMIYGPELLKSLKKLPTKHFLAVGARFDLDLTQEITYRGKWWERLVEQTHKQGKLHPPLGSDYFIYNKQEFSDLPPFAVGRIRWDNWMLYAARHKGLTTIDCTNEIMAIHQNHDYAHQLNGGKNYEHNPEAKANEKLARDVWRPYTLRDANWVLTSEGVKRKRYTLAEYLEIVKDNVYGIREKMRRAA